MGRDYYGWGPYVSVAERRRQAAQKVAKMKKAGRQISPIEIDGRKIATTFWGDAWCTNLEAYSDYSNRLPRGRTYVRNCSVIDLQIEAGQVRSLVSGSDIYEIDIKIEPLAKTLWTGIKKQCAGQIGSLVELLRGSISKGVMEIVTRKGEGLFPTPKEISMSCSCPDWATMCKHVAATLYGVGARLDHEPEMLFVLRGVDLAEMLDAAGDQPPASGQARRGRVLDSHDLSSVFGVDIDLAEASQGQVATSAKRGKRAASTGKKIGKTAPAPPKAKTTAKPSPVETDLAEAYRRTDRNLGQARQAGCINRQEDRQDGPSPTKGQDHRQTIPSRNRPGRSYRRKDRTDRQARQAGCINRQEDRQDGPSPKKIGKTAPAPRKNATPAKPDKTNPVEIVKPAKKRTTGKKKSTQ